MTRISEAIERIFTKEELDRARELYIKHKELDDHDAKHNKPGDHACGSIENRYEFRHEVCDQLVGPKMEKIRKYTGSSNTPGFWVYCLDRYLTRRSQERGAVTRH
jgi:hypothetical protein